MDQSDLTISASSLFSEILQINCMQLSFNQEIIYFAGTLQAINARESCPILAFNTRSGGFEGEFWSSYLGNQKEKLKLRTLGGSQI